MHADVGFPPIPVESAAPKPAATVSQSSAAGKDAAAASDVAALPLKVSPRPQIQRQSK